MTQVEPPPLRPEDRPKRRLSLWVKLLCGFAVFLILLFFGGVAAFYAYASSVRNELKETEAAVREAGFPVDLEEVEALYREIPEEENGAPVYLEAYNALQASTIESDARDSLWEQISLLEPGQGIPVDLLARMKGQADAAQSALRLLVEAATRPKVRFDVDLSQLADVDWSHVRKLQELSRMLCIAGLVAAEEGDWNRYAALHDVRAHMISALNEEPILLSKLVRSAMLRMSLTEFGLVFSQWTVPPDALAALAECYGVSEGRAEAVETIAVERCVAVNMVEAAVQGQLDGGEGPFAGITNQPSGSLSASLVDQRTRLKIYRFSNRLVGLDEKDWPEWIPESDALAEELDAARYTAPLARLVVPSLNDATTAFVRTAATIRMIQAAVAVERFRAATGGLPESLAELLPTYLDSVPGDPFDGAPLRYRKEEMGYILYSVYENLTDDGGAPMESRGADERSAGDWVFTVVR